MTRDHKQTDGITNDHDEQQLFDFVEIEEKCNRQIHSRFFLGIKSQILLSLFQLQDFTNSPLTNTMRISRRGKRDHLNPKIFERDIQFLLHSVESNCVAGIN